MRHIFILLLALLLSSCGYHLVGQGQSHVIPHDTRTVTLQTTPSTLGKILLAELRAQWLQRESLPHLQEGSGKTHVTLRIENPEQAFTPVAFDASGLAIQYRLSVSGVLRMYQEHSLIWQSGLVTSSADIFGDAAALSNNPASVEAEREALEEQLHQKWAQDVLARLQSGF